MKSIDETKRFGLTQSLLDAVKSVVAAEAEDNRSVDQINASKVALKAAATAQALAAGVGKPTAPGEDDMEPEDVPVDAEPEQEIPIDSDLDPVNDAENDKDFDDREDQDIDNDGDVDGSDEYLHKRRAATDDAIDAADEEDVDINVDADDDDEDEEEDDVDINVDDDEESDEEEGEEDEDESEDEGEDDEDPEANDVPPEMDSDDESGDEEEDGESDDEEGDDVETRNVGDMSDDELEQELAMRRKKSKDEEEVEINPQMEAYLRKISSDVSKRRITESKLDEIAPAIGAAVGAIGGAIAGAAKKAIDAKKTIDQNKAKKEKKESSDDDTNKFPDGSTIGPVSGDAGPDGGKKESWKKKMEGLTDKQKQLDVDGDGDIGGDDLAKLRAQKKEQLMASKSYYEGKYGNRWETVMDKVAEKLAQESCGKKHK